MLAEFCVRIYKHVRLQPVVRAVTDASEIVRRIFCFEPLRHCAINVRIHTSDIIICVLHRRHRATPGNTVTQHTNVERRCSAKKKKSRRQAGELIFSFYVHCCSYAKLPHCVAFLNVSMLLGMPGTLLFFAEHCLFALFCHCLAPCCWLLLHSAHVKISDVWMRTLVNGHKA